MATKGGHLVDGRQVNTPSGACGAEETLIFRKSQGCSGPGITGRQPDPRTQMVRTWRRRKSQAAQARWHRPREQAEPERVSPQPQYAPLDKPGSICFFWWHIGGMWFRRNVWVFFGIIWEQLHENNELVLDDTTLTTLASANHDALVEVLNPTLSASSFCVVC